MNQKEAVFLLAKAINKAVHDHGRPNTFYTSELEEEYGGPSKAWCNKIGRASMNPHHRYFNDLYAALGGYYGFGSAPTYHKGKFFV